MMNALVSRWLLFLLGVGGMLGLAHAQPACRALPLADPAEFEEISYDEGLLWRVGTPAGAVNYLYGTIHLGDEQVVALPDPVRVAFDASETFVMETILDPRAALAFSQLMFFDDGQELTEHLDAGLFQRTADLLARHGIPEATARQIKPWAAYLTLSFPPSDDGPPLDMVLMEQAYGQHKAVRGLESIEEQAGIFEQMPLTDQLRLLVDLVCNYDNVQLDLSALRQAYLQRDLQQLVRVAGKYNVEGEAAYERLMQVLLADRNRRMVKRLIPLLRPGGAFVAVGALHLPDEDGLLALLAARGYSVEVAY